MVVVFFSETYKKFTFYYQKLSLLSGMYVSAPIIVTFLHVSMAQTCYWLVEISRPLAERNNRLQSPAIIGLSHESMVTIGLFLNKQ